MSIAGCESAVGDPCLPEKIPQETNEKGEVVSVGFSKTEAYIETSSVQCETRVCLVYKLEGDPSPGCETIPDVRTCPTEKEKEDKVYCSCRCKTDDKSFATCECPDGYDCVEVQETGAPGSRGSYCVKQGTH